MTHSSRISVDLAAYPNLVVVYLGFRIQGLRAFRQLRGIGQGLAAMKAAPPPGLLRHEGLLWGWNHVGMRQYWRDFPSLEAFTRSSPHAEWWKEFGRGAGGSGFWHETYCRAGGMEGIYLDMPPLGFGAFAEARAPVGGFKTSRQRLAA